MGEIQENPVFLPTPTRRQRRLDFDIDNTLKEKVDGASLFRTGYPNPMLPLPLVNNIPTFNEEIDRKEYGSISKSTIKILEANGLKWKSIDYFSRHLIGTQPHADHNTLLITATIHERQAAITAVEAISDLLGKYKTPLKIEILDPRAHESIFVADITDEELQQWPLCKSAILDVLGYEPLWKSLDLLNVGDTKKDSTPTVIIGITDHASLEWQRQAYKKICEILQRTPSLDVIFNRSTFALLQTARRPPIAVDPQDCTGPVAIGKSIGVKGVLNSTGTLGGYVQVRYKGTTYTMALTCHHVICSLDMSDDERIKGCPPDLNRKLKVCAPSDADFHESVQMYEQARGEQRDIIEGPESQPTRPSSGRTLGLQSKVEVYGQANLEPKLREHKRRLESLERQIALLNQLDRGRLFGSVFASSGLDRTYNGSGPGLHANDDWAMDWALIQVEKSRQGRNSVPFDILKPLCSGFEVEEYCRNSPQLDERVSKQGRNGYSEGRVSGIESTILFEDQISKRVSAFVVVGVKDGVKVGAEEHTQEFLREGDSGSWALDGGQRFSMLGFGGHIDGSRSYCTPVAWVFEDIRIKTGAEITTVNCP